MHMHISERFMNIVHTFKVMFVVCSSDIVDFTHPLAIIYCYWSQTGHTAAQLRVHYHTQ